MPLRPEEYERLQLSNVEQLQALLEQLPKLIEERKAIAVTSAESTPTPPTIPQTQD
jgi:hypothetical protein